MKKKLILILFLITVTSLSAATLSGTIKDIKTNKPLEFANIAVYEKDTETIKTGTMSGVDGTFRIFNVPDGNYYLVVIYMGYEKKHVNDITIAGKVVDIGVISLTPVVLEMDNITVEAEKPAITYKIDKQVIDARQFITAGGTAVDILENIPSVQVDIEGNISVNNSNRITVMIDGRPSILEPKYALKIIPAETIENIEIMINPSAKYEAEGGAGIINVVTKQDKRIGLAGLASCRIGTSVLNGTALVNYTNKNISANISLDFLGGNTKSEFNQDRYLYLSDTTVNQKYESVGNNGLNGAIIKSSLNWTITKNDMFGFSAKYFPRISTVSFIKDYTVSNTNPVTGTIFNTNDYINYENSDNSSELFDIVADYIHTFPEKKEENDSNSKSGLSKSSSKRHTSHSSIKHQMKFAASYSNKDSDKDISTYFVDVSGDTTEGQWTTKIGPVSSLRGKIDYTRPLNNSSHIETGAIANFNWKTDGNNVYEYNPLTGDLDLQNQFSNLTDYLQNTLSAYALFNAEFGKLGFQSGIRAEYTYREIENNTIDSVYTLDDLNIFPSLHFSYQLPSNIQLMGSYSRRIYRPAGYQLEPFYTWEDAYNISIGNPALKPEISDSYQLNALKFFGKNSISLNIYYRQTKDKTQTIQTIYNKNNNVIQSTYENVGKDQFFGLNLSPTLYLFSWWRLNIFGSLYYYQIEGELYGETISKGSINYSTKLNNTFTLPTKTIIQLQAAYHSGTATVQGSSSSRVTTNLGLRHNFFKGKLSASLLISDILGTDYIQNETFTPTAYIYSEYYRDSPRILFNLSLKINNYKRQRSVSSIESDGFDSENNGQY